MTALPRPHAIQIAVELALDRCAAGSDAWRVLLRAALAAHESQARRLAQQVAA